MSVNFPCVWCVGSNPVMYPRRFRCGKITYIHPKNDTKGGKYASTVMHLGMYIYIYMNKYNIYIYILHIYTYICYIYIYMYTNIEKHIHTHTYRLSMELTRFNTCCGHGRCSTTGKTRRSPCGVAS